MSVLISAEGDLRRTMLFHYQDLSGGYQAEYKPWADGLAQYNLKVVSSATCARYHLRPRMAST
jgi:hypothetical protein